MKRHPKPYDLLLPGRRTLLYGTFLIFSIVLTGVLSSCTEEDDFFDDPVEKFLGTWSVSDQPARLNYSVTIEKDPGNTAYLILKNFADMGGSARGLVVGDNIVIEKQDIGSGYSCNGTGTYKTKYELDFLFTLDDGIDKENRKAVFTK